MTSIDLSDLDIRQLTELLAKAQTEMASREKQGRRDLRAELERRITAEGYKMADLFPELGAASSSAARRKWPAKYRDPQNPEQPWSGIGRTPKWVQAILDELGIDRAAFKSIPSDPPLELSQRACGRSEGRRRRVEAVPKRGAASAPSRSASPERAGLRRGRTEGARDDGRRMRQVARVRSPALERGHAPLGGSHRGASTHKR